MLRQRLSGPNPDPVNQNVPFNKCPNDLHESKGCLMKLFALSSPNPFTANCCCQVASPTLLSFGLLLFSPFSLFPFLLSSFPTTSPMILLTWMEPKGLSSIANVSQRNPDHTVFCHLCICSRPFFMDAQDFLLL